MLVRCPLFRAGTLVAAMFAAHVSTAHALTLKECVASIEPHKSRYVERDEVERFPQGGMWCGCLRGSHKRAGCWCRASGCVAHTHTHHDDRRTPTRRDSRAWS